MTITFNISRDDLLAAMNANTPKPRPLTTTEQSAAGGSKFARPNFARQQAAAAKPEPAWKSEPATTAQIEGIEKRLALRVGNPEAEAIRKARDLVVEKGRMDKGWASEIITRLDAIRPNPQPVTPTQSYAQAKPAAPQTDAWKRPNCVPDGNYALVQDGVVKFYEVNTPTEGKYAGICFVSVHASDDRYNVKGHARHAILDALVKDPAAAARLYGQKSLSCGHCGKELSKAQSRASGYGPTCARKHGYTYYSLDEALDILGEGEIDLSGITDLPSGFTVRAK